MFGANNDDCQTLEVQENDWIKGINFSYDYNGVNWIRFTTNNEDYNESGEQEAHDQSKWFSFDNDPFAFYGLVGTDKNKISSLSIVRYDKVCYETAKTEKNNTSSEWSVANFNEGSSTSRRNGLTEPNEYSEFVITNLKKPETSNVKDEGKSNLAVNFMIVGIVIILIVSVSLVLILSRRSKNKASKKIEDTQNLDTQAELVTVSNHEPLRLDLSEISEKPKIIKTVSFAQETVT